MRAFHLTPLGERRALRVDPLRGPEEAVITILYEQKDALEASEIAGEVRMDEAAAERILTRLVNRGYVKEA